MALLELELEVDGADIDNSRRVPQLLLGKIDFILGYLMDYDNINCLVGIALVEIRASENLRTAQVIADIFHNVPSQVSAKIPVEIICKNVLDRSKLFGLDEVILSWMDGCNINL